MKKIVSLILLGSLAFGLFAQEITMQTISAASQGTLDLNPLGLTSLNIKTSEWEQDILGINKYSSSSGSSEWSGLKWVSLIGGTSLIGMGIFTFCFADYPLSGIALGMGIGGLIGGACLFTPFFFIE